MEHYLSNFRHKRRHNRFLPIALMSLFFLAFTTEALAQSQNTLSGNVTDTQTGEPLLGATLELVGTNFYAISDDDGNYVIDGLTEGTYTVRCSYLSYKTQTGEVAISPGQNSVLDFNLQIDLLQMDEVVVTGVVSKNSKAVSTIAVQRINTTDLTEKNSFNSVHELLSGKVAGVSLQRSGGGFGAGTRFIVRSGGGINGSGQPLIFVDGVRMSNNSFDAGRGEGGGISSLVGLNPEDIENVEIIKGPAGSASYGTGAANGVVSNYHQKRVLPVEGWEVNYKGTMGFNDLRELKERDFRNYQYMNDNFFKTGQIVKNSFNISGGSDEIRAFFSVDRNDEAGHTPASDFEQTNARLNLDFNPSPKLSMKGKYTIW